MAGQAPMGHFRPTGRTSDERNRRGGLHREVATCRPAWFDSPDSREFFANIWQEAEQHLSAN
jgi:hypothetical protein